MTLCRACNRNPAQRDGFCPGCRLRARTVLRFPFREEWNQILCRGYRAARRRPDVTALVSQVQRLTGYPRHVIGFQAQRLGLRFIVQRPWTPEETARLLDLAGTMQLRRLAARLHRSELSVRNRLHALRSANTLFASYSIAQLRELFGVPHRRVEQWLQRGWLSLDQDRRIPDSALRRFVWQHLEQIEFRRADEAWLKGMLKASREPAASEVA